MAGRICVRDEGSFYQASFIILSVHIKMWSYVGKKSNPRWLWHAIDRRSGEVLAYVFGCRKKELENQNLAVLWRIFVGV